MRATKADGTDNSHRFNTSLYKTIIEPNLDLIVEMWEAGLGDKTIYDTFGITGSTWFRYKMDRDLALYGAIEAANKRKAKAQVEQAKALAKVIPKKAEIANVMVDLLYNKELDKLNAKEIDIIWNKLYPEDNFQKQFLVDKVEIARFEAETKRMALNNIFVEDENTGELLTSFLDQFSPDSETSEDEMYDDLLANFTDEYEDEDDD